MRRLKAQLVDMFSGKSQTPPDSINLPDPATNISGDFVFVDIKPGENTERHTKATQDTRGYSPSVHAHARHTDASGLLGLFKFAGEGRTRGRIPEIRLTLYEGSRSSANRLIER